MKKVLLFIAILPLAINAQTINTVAGNGTAGYSGNYGPATAAELSNPSGAAYDHSGNLYISDCDNHTIRKVSTSGVITTIAGTGVAGYNGDGIPATTAQLNRPIKIYIDASDNIYFGDLNNHRIRKINTAGIISTVAGNGISGYSGDGVPAIATSLSYPSGVAFDTSGNMYVADYYNFRVRKVNTAGIISTYAGTGVAGYGGDNGPATAAQLNLTFGLVFDHAQNLYLADALNNRIRIISPSGVIKTFAGTGTLGYNGDGIPATAADLQNSAGVTIDPAGNIYIADQFNQRVRKVTAAGMISTVAGSGVAGFFGDGGLATMAKINNCNEITVSPAGNLVICDVTNNRIRVVTLDCEVVIATPPVSDTTGYGGNASFYVSTIAVAPSYQWQKNAGSGFVNLSNTPPYSGVTTDTLHITGALPSQDSNFFRCVITQSPGCSDTTTGAILRVYKSFGTDTGTGVGTPSIIKEVMIYPNPAHGYITIEGAFNNATIELFNELGQIMYKKTDVFARTEIDMSKMPAGFYFVRVHTGNSLFYQKMLRE